jgi:hypothetical protein
MFHAGVCALAVDSAVNGRVNASIRNNAKTDFCFLENFLISIKFFSFGKQPIQLPTANKFHSP